MAPAPTITPTRTRTGVTAPRPPNQRGPAPPVRPPPGRHPVTETGRWLSDGKGVLSKPALPTPPGASSTVSRAIQRMNIVTCLDALAQGGETVTERVGSPESWDPPPVEWQAPRLACQ